MRANYGEAVRRRLQEEGISDKAADLVMRMLVYTGDKPGPLPGHGLADTRSKPGGDLGLPMTTHNNVGRLQAITQYGIG